MWLLYTLYYQQKKNNKTNQQQKNNKMDNLDEMSKTGGGKQLSFFNHVFNMNDASKSDMLNTLQYASLALIPIVAFNKTMQKYIPEADEDKSTMEITVEVLLQVFSLFLAMILIHRIITFVPTYSGEKYAEFHVTSVILSMLIIISSLQTKLGEKVSILFDRVVQLWNGTAPESKKKKKQGGASNPNHGILPMATPPMTGVAGAGGTAISSLPPVQQSMQQHQGMPDPDMMGMGEPMAANMGGSAFGSAFGW